MEYLQNEGPLELKINEETKSILKGLSNWMSITAIAAISGAGVSLLIMLKEIFKFSHYSFMSSMPLTYVALDVIVIASTVVLNIILIAAANALRTGLAGREQYHINKGIGKLALYLKITGIIIICVLGIFLLFFIFGVMMAASGGFGR